MIGCCDYGCRCNELYRILTSSKPKAPVILGLYRRGTTGGPMEKIVRRTTRTVELVCNVHSRVMSL